ncbi:MAG: type II toxin-antitoxin system HigB family toxin [Syntrophobacteraceae bacterium]|nr:type II toxin-antitoxin system HigB family toxin [Syntrophobacteraceae bacterium]
MRIIGKSRLKNFWEGHGQAERVLQEWYSILDKAKWKNFDDLRKIYPSADQVSIKSGRTATVFDIGGNNYRLIAAVHYNKQTVYILDVMTHAEYDKNAWKNKF